MTPPKYRVFISYSHQDMRWARWCQRSLETYQVPKNIQAETGCPARIGQVYRDADELGLASDLSETIREALTESEYLLVICSPSAGASSWVNREVTEFQKLGRENRVFCLLVDGDPQDEHCLPEALRHRDQHAPLMVDPRPPADGKRVALTRIVASLLNIEFSRLQDRQARRRHNRMIGVTAIALIAVIVTSSLAVVAINARDIAVVERERAESQELIAQQSLDFLVDVFRVSDPSEARGNTATARELLDRASVRIADELADDPDARITLMNTIASVYTNLGLYRASIELLEQSMQARETVNSLGTLDAAQTFTDIATAYHHLGEYQQAIDLHLRALAIRERLATDEADIAHSLDNIGAAFYFIDEFDDARTYMTRALEIRRNLYPEMNLEIATSLNNIGALSSQLGDLKTAVEHQQQAYAAFKEVLGPDHQRTLIVLNNLALDAQARGLVNETGPLYEELKTLTETIHEPPHPDLANMYNNYGLFLLEGGDPEAALSYFKEAELQWSQTLGDEHHRTMTAQSLIGYGLLVQGEPQAAHAQLTETVDRQRQVLGSHSSMPNSLAFLALAKYELGDYEGGLVIAEQAHEMAVNLYPLNAGRQAIFYGFVARGLDLLGEHEQALEILQQGRPAVTTSYAPQAYAARRYERWIGEAQRGAGDGP